MSEFFIFLLQAVICMNLLYGFYMLTLQDMTSFKSNRLFLLCGALIGIAIPLLTIEFSATAFGGLSSSLTSISNTLNNGSILEQPVLLGLSWAHLLLLVYLGGVLFFGVRFLLRLGSLYAVIKAAEKEDMVFYQVIKSAKEFPTFSFLNYILISKENATTEEEERQIIRHELLHIKQRHSWDVLFFEIVQILFWFNPLFHLVKKRLKDVHEYIVDAEITKNYSKKEYAELLLKQATSRHHKSMLLTNNLSKNQIKNRIVMLTKEKTNRLSKAKYALTLPIVVLLLGLFSISLTQEPVADELPDSKITEAVKFSDYSLDSDGNLVWFTKNETEGLLYSIEIYRWSRWVKIGRVPGNEVSDPNGYSFKVAMHTGENKVRVSCMNQNGQVLARFGAKVADSNVQGVRKSVSENQKEITFSNATLYEIYTGDEMMVKRGFGPTVDISNLKPGVYELYYDNTVESFEKK